MTRAEQIAQTERLIAAYRALPGDTPLGLLMVNAPSTRLVWANVSASVIATLKWRLIELEAA